MQKKIPQSVIGMLGEVVPENESHASLDSLFLYADAPGDPPDGSKPVKTIEWLRRCNRDPDVDPIAVLKVIVEHYLDEEVDEFSNRYEFIIKRNERIEKCLRKSGLNELVSGDLSHQSKTLEEAIADLDSESIEYEFSRAIESVDDDPFEAISAASNILESTIRVLLEDSDIELPKKKDLGSLWNVIRKELNLDPSVFEDQDIQKIVSGLGSIVTGIAALRTHSSSAHGRGRFRYNLQKRHVNLTIHSAHSLCLFLIETWRIKND
jgi:hypothetical protein